MTIIAAMWDDDGESILIGADSGIVDVTGTAVFTSAVSNKLRIRHESDISLVWGIAGDRTLGERFNAAIAKHLWPSDWIAAQEQATQLLAVHNGYQRTVISQSGSQPQQDDLIQLLCVGYAHNALRLFSVDERSVLTITEGPRAEDPMRTGFSAIGGGAVHAKAMHIAYTKGLQQKNNIETFTAVMNLTADYAFGIARPIHIYRVSKIGIQEIS